MTPLERPAGMPGGHDRRAKPPSWNSSAVRRRIAPLDKALTAIARAAQEGGDGSVGPAGNVGGYNNFWLDRGSAYAYRSTGSAGRRSSSDPADGPRPR